MQTKQKFLELLMKRFMDKSAFCRKEVIKAFTRLTEENLVPPYSYMELFQAVIGRLKDAAVLVRKSALNLYQQLICIYALIFRIDVMKG
jgi:condensin complex subunit 1